MIIGEGIHASWMMMMGVVTTRIRWLWIQIPTGKRAIVDDDGGARSGRHGRSGPIGGGYKAVRKAISRVVAAASATIRDAAAVYAEMTVAAAAAATVQSIHMRIEEARVAQATNSTIRIEARIEIAFSRDGGGVNERVIIICGHCLLFT